MPDCGRELEFETTGDGFISYYELAGPISTHWRPARRPPRGAEHRQGRENWATRPRWSDGQSLGLVRVRSFGLSPSRLMARMANGRRLQM